MAAMIALEKIRIDGETQQRPLDEEALAEYGQMLADGLEAPPVQAVFDGKDYWLWDGFHRYHVARKAGARSLAVLVTKGTRRDALFLSFSANRQHGVRRQPGVTAAIIAKMLADPEWSKMSPQVIAEHVGVSRQYVAKVKSGCNQLHPGNGPGATVKGRDGKHYPAGKLPVGNTGIRTQSEGELEDVDLFDHGSGGQGGAQPPAAAASESAPAEELLDEVGLNLLTLRGDQAQGIVAAFRRRAELSELMSQASRLKSTVGQAMRAADPLFADLNHSQFVADCDNLFTALKAIRPYAVCCYCGGDGCKACLGRGWLGEFKFKQAPEEMRAAAVKAAGKGAR